MRRTSRRREVSDPAPDQPCCGLCGKRGRLTRTECCNNWICDDNHKYVPFSFARNSCFRNHSNYTVCSFHHHEQHEGDWKSCSLCRETFPTELYVWHGTNEYNFEKLDNIPAYEPTRCNTCGSVIRLAEDGYMLASGDQYTCLKCSNPPDLRVFQRTDPRKRRW